MKIVYQGGVVETPAATVAAFIASRGIDAAAAIVEYEGEVYAPGADLDALELKPSAVLDVFRIMAGG